MIAGEDFHPGLVVGGALAEDLSADGRNTDHVAVAEEVHHLLGPRQAAQVTVNDNAVEAVVDESQHLAEQLGEQFHGSPPKTRQGSQTNQARTRPADHRRQGFSSGRRGALYSAPSGQSPRPYRDRRSADPVLHRNRRYLVARPPPP